MDKTIEAHEGSPDPTSKRVRGGVVLALIAFVDERLDAKTRAVVFSQIPDDLLSNLRRLERGAFYTYEYSNAIMRGIAATESDPVRAYALAKEAAVFVADDAITTFLRLLVKFLKPALFARKWGDFFRKDHNFGRVETDLRDIERNRFAITLSDVEGYWYVGAVGSGWIVHLLTCMGCKDVKVSETLNPPPASQDADRYRFEVTWS